MNLKSLRLKKEKKQQQINSNDSLKPELIFQIHNLLNPRLGVCQKTQFKVEWWNKKIKNLLRFKK